MSMALTATAPKIAVTGSFGEFAEGPFPHWIADDWLEPGLYRALVDSFPECPPASGPTGFTLFWGDPDYDALVSGHPAWKRLFEEFHSQSFIDRIVGAFAPVVGRDLRVDLSGARYVPYCETRAEKQRLWLRDPPHAPDELWVRLDVMQGREGYGRKAHLDHRRRLASLLIYMCDADENAMSGGDLVLHGAGGDLVVRPRHNRMVLFPCHSASLHSVTPIVSQSAPRSFVQVTVSSCVDLWEPGPPAWQRVARALGF
jgi:hypothetical protein